MPAWFKSTSPQVLRQAIIDGSEGLTDKVDDIHQFENLYHKYLSPMAMQICNQTRSKRIRILEIGLGCAPGGGMIRGTPGGSAKAWRY